MNTIPRLLQVVEALAAASAWSLIRRLTQTSLQRQPERGRGIPMKFLAESLGLRSG
jgi:hypothetical protein